MKAQQNRSNVAKLPTPKRSGVKTANPAEMTPQGSAVESPEPGEVPANEVQAKIIAKAMGDSRKSWGVLLNAARECGTLAEFNATIKAAEKIAGYGISHTSLGVYLSKLRGMLEGGCNMTPEGAYAYVEKFNADNAEDTRKTAATADERTLLSKSKDWTPVLAQHWIKHVKNGGKTKPRAARTEKEGEASPEQKVAQEATGGQAAPIVAETLSIVAKLDERYRLVFWQRARLLADEVKAEAGIADASDDADEGGNADADDAAEPKRRRA